MILHNSTMASYASTIRSVSAVPRIQSRRIHGTPPQSSSPFFHLAALSASREGQFISKASGVSRVDYSPNSQLLRAEAIGSTLPERSSVGRTTAQVQDQQINQELKQSNHGKYTTSSEVLKGPTSVRQPNSIVSLGETLSKLSSGSPRSVENDESLGQAGTRNIQQELRNISSKVDTMANERSWTRDRETLVSHLKASLEREKQARIKAEERARHVSVQMRRRDEAISEDPAWPFGIGMSVFLLLASMGVGAWIAKRMPFPPEPPRNAVSKGTLESAERQKAWSGIKQNSEQDAETKTSGHLASWFWSSPK